MKITCTAFFLLLSSLLLGQNDRFFTEKEAIEWLPYLIATNMEIIGEKNDKGIAATESRRLNFMFISDTEQKVRELKEALVDMEAYRFFRTYRFGAHWTLSGLSPDQSMDFKELADWTMDLSARGFKKDCQLIGWDFHEEEKAAKAEKFWEWFAEDQEDFFNLDPENGEEVSRLFDLLSEKLAPFNSELFFEFSGEPVDGKREFILTADGDPDHFADVLYLYKYAPEIPNWIIFPFKQPSDGEFSITYNGMPVAWEDIYFTHKIEEEGVDLELYIKGYDGKNHFYGIAYLFLDSYLGEFDAAMFISGLELFPLPEKKKELKKLQPFIELKEIVESFKVNSIK